MTDPRVIEVFRDDARDAALAQAAAGGFAVLVASGDAALARAGEIARDVSATGGRVAVFDGVLENSADNTAVSVLLAELDVQE
jgi:hypothetical protein